MQRKVSSRLFQMRIQTKTFGAGAGINAADPLKSSQTFYNPVVAAQRFSAERALQRSGSASRAHTPDQREPSLHRSGGQANAKNVALASAGRFIAILDADDIDLAGSIGWKFAAPQPERRVPAGARVATSPREVHLRHHQQHWQRHLSDPHRRGDLRRQRQARQRA